MSRAAICVLLAAVLAAVGALLLAACSTGTVGQVAGPRDGAARPGGASFFGGESTASSAPQPAASPDAPPRARGWSPIGFQQDSLGLAGNEGFSQYAPVPSANAGAPQQQPGGRVALLGDIPMVFKRQVSESQVRHGGAGGVPMLAANEELWIIQKFAPAPEAPARDDTPGCGVLMTRIPADDGQTRDVPVPLKHTDVKAAVSGFFSSVDVTQQFHNPYSTKIEALYLFPLPENAAVSEFVMTVGDRHIRGIIRERQVAEKIYSEARAAGHVASLLTQERPNIFTQHVANIEPGKSIDISIRYYGTLPYSDGAYEFVFPMVVGPRFNPPGTTDGVGTVGHGDAGTSGQATEIQYLRPSERSGHDIAVRVDVEAGVELESIICPTHKVEVKRPSLSAASVVLSSLDTVPNRDFVLRIGVAGERVKSTLLTCADEKGEGGHFALMLVPPKDLASLQRGPMEMVFVLDCSGSMSGRPMEQAKAATERALRSLRPGDSFQLINFSNTASQLGASPLEATPGNVRRGLDYLRTVDAGGGTMMLNGVRAALEFPHDPERLRFVAFLTDGYIGNEAEILGAMHQRLGASRVFSFGIGTSVNRHLIESMARMGSGAAAYVNLADSSEEIMDAFFERVSHPALHDLSIDWGGAEVSDLTPSRVPDLFVGRPVVLTGRYKGDWAGTVRVSGRAGGEPQDIRVAPETMTVGAQAAALPQVWARMRIGELADRSAWDPNPELSVQVRRTALDYGLMSSFTAFVAVDSLSKTEGTYGTTVAVPVPTPAGVKYDTAVGGSP